MDLSIYNVIKGPWLTTKTQALNQDRKQLVFEVHPKANKPMIMYALKKLFNIDAEDVRVILVKGKRRRQGRHFVFGIKRKKAIISLPKDMKFPTELSLTGAPTTEISTTGMSTTGMSTTGMSKTGMSSGKVINKEE